MRYYILLVINFSLFFTSTAQIDESKAFDFWVGEWVVSWYDSDSTLITGTNTITKILDGKVLQEQFNDPSTNFKGSSLSVYNPISKEWHQAWADNQGVYYNFIGVVNETIRIFKTPHPSSSGMLFRMRFENIKEDSFIWYWEGKKEESKNWNLLWKVNYNMKKE